MNGDELRSRSMAFAKRIVGSYQYLCESKREFILSKQLLRCGTSIGANISEAQYGSSRRDFLNKLYIAFKNDKFDTELLKQFLKALVGLCIDSKFSSNKFVQTFIVQLSKDISANCVGGSFEDFINQINSSL